MISGDSTGTVIPCEVEKAAKLSPSWSEVPQRTVVLAGKNPWKLVVFRSRCRCRWSAGVGRTGRFWRGGRRKSTGCASWKRIHPATEQRIPRIRILKVMKANKPNTFWSLNTSESNVLMSILCVLFCHHVEVAYNVVTPSRLADESCKVICNLHEGIQVCYQQISESTSTVISSMDMKTKSFSMLYPSLHIFAHCRIALMLFIF